MLSPRHAGERAAPGQRSLASSSGGASGRRPSVPSACGPWRCLPASPCSRWRWVVRPRLMARRPGKLGGGWTPVARKKVAELFVETLAMAGVKRVYGVAGDSLNGITDAIRPRDDIQWCHVRHEE